MEKELKDFLDKKFTDIDKKLVQVDEKIDKKTEEVLHQFRIISENLEDKIKQVAEGVVSLNEKMDRRFDEMNRNIEQKHQDVLSARSGYPRDEIGESPIFSTNARFSSSRQIG
jgi:hypothetical protein